jgi:medium-chain acyl-[acyl-carrier-protein] hydrolase
MSRSLACWRLARANPAAAVRLFCFPYAGGSASVFRDWHRDLPAFVEVVGLQAHDRSLRTGAPRDIPSLVADVGTALVAHLDRPFVFFGHSLGAIVAFEMTRWLRDCDLPAPEILLLSARRAPGVAPRQPQYSRQSDEELVRTLRRLNGTPHDMLADSNLARAILPRVRADLALADGYRCRRDAPLDVPLVVFGGRDDPECHVTELLAWRRATTGRFTRHLFEGDHFFLHSARHALLRQISYHLQSVVQR